MRSQRAEKVPGPRPCFLVGGVRLSDSASGPRTRRPDFGQGEPASGDQLAVRCVLRNLRTRPCSSIALQTYSTASFPSASASPSKAGFAPAAIPKPASPSSAFTMVRALPRCRWWRPAISPTTRTDVLRLGTGCAVHVRRHVGRVPGQGAGDRDSSRHRSSVVGWVQRSGDLPDAAQAPLHGVPARSRPPAARAPTSSAPSPGSATGWPGRAPLLPRARLLLVHTPIITASDCEGAGEMFRVTTLDMANLPRTEAGGIDFAQGLLRTRSPPHRLRPAQRREPTAWP